MNFKEWLLENNLPIRFTGFWSDGTINVVVNGKKYVFSSDPVYHTKWQQLARFKPFAVLNDIKNYVKKGYAQQIQPTPVNSENIPRLKQKLLFSDLE